MAVADFAELAAAGRRPLSLRSVSLREGDTQPTGNDTLLVTPQFIDNGSRAGRPEPEAGPTTADALAYSTDSARSVYHQAAASGDVYVGAIGQSHVQSSTSATFSQGLMIDLLCVQGGLSTSVTTSQTTNLPTAALPSRATGGAGVWAAAYCSTSAASTDTTVTYTYTNQAGTGSQTTSHLWADTFADSSLVIIPFAPGDTGIRSIESVQLSAATGTGVWGVFLFKPLFCSAAVIGNQDFTRIGGWNSNIEDEAVLVWLSTYQALSVGQTTATTFSFFEA